jgi:hypothetical protein
MVRLKHARGWVLVCKDCLSTKYVRARALLEEASSLVERNPRLARDVGEFLRDVP